MTPDSSPRRVRPSNKLAGGDPPVDARGIWTCRPVRKVIWLLVIVAGGCFLVNSQLLQKFYSPLSTYRMSRPDGFGGSRWVGGGTVGVSISNHDLKPDTSATNSSNHQQDDEDDEKSDAPLPQAIRIPLIAAVADVQLEGWEDDWFAYGRYDAGKHGKLKEPKIDFVYNWVNGSDNAFNELRRDYEVKSPLNDPEGKWMTEHGVNRYRDWDELRYSLRSINAYASGFLNKVQILVNSVRRSGDDDNASDPRRYEYRNDGQSMIPQRPGWMRDEDRRIQILPQEELFGESTQQCLPTFNSLSIESQIHLTPSNTDRLVALSDDMLLGMPHAASDFYSPLFGTVMAFKTDKYNIKSLGPRDRWPTFGEKPFAYYTSYLLNHRFGERSRRVQAHFGHSISRAVMREAMDSFPGPANRGACERFRGESHFQIYPWFTAFHYSIERFREALLWSFIVSRSDADSDGYLDWTERQQILDAIRPGWARLVQPELVEHADEYEQIEINGSGGDPASAPAPEDENRERMYYRVADELEAAGLEKPKANLDVLWTSLDGPETIRGIKCHDFTIDKCLGDGFGSPLSDDIIDRSGRDGGHDNPDFSASAVFTRLAVQHSHCGDCLIKFVLSTAAAAAAEEEETEAQTESQDKADNETHAADAEPAMELGLKMHRSEETENGHINEETTTTSSSPSSPPPKPHHPKKKHRGLEALLPPKTGPNSESKLRDREVVIRALKKYQHTVVDTEGSMKFVMIKDAEQAERELLERNVRKGREFGQWCLNDDVMTDSAEEVGEVREVMGRVFEELWPGRSPWEREEW